MRTRIGIGALSVCAAAALCAGSALAQTPTLRVSHAAAQVVISAENRPDLVVSVRGGAARLPTLRMRRDGGVIVVEGGLDTRSLNCDGGSGASRLFGGVDHRRDTRRVKLSGVGWVNVADLPVITVHAPRAVAISTDGAVWGQAGPSDAFSLDAGGCGDWRIAAVRGKLNVHISGSGDIQAVSAGALQLDIAGSGDVALHTVAGPARITVTGSGDVHLGALAGGLEARLRGAGDLIADRVDGSVKADLSGSSNLKINGGRVRPLSVQVSGSGDFVFNGAAAGVSAAVSGSGDIHLAHTSGSVVKSVAGSGTITIDR